MTTIKAGIIADSTYAGNRITTMMCTYPLVIHAEVMTHRMFSRNAASSRAIPAKRLIEDVERDPFVPLVWGSNKPGMQAGEEIDTPVRIFYPCRPSGGTDYPGWLEDIGSDEHTDSLESGDVSPQNAWLSAMRLAVWQAKRFNEAGYHKQIVNRLLAPFAHIHTLITATEWDNFFALRCHPDAEPHMRMLAEAMREAMASSEPTERERHMPFTGKEEEGMNLYELGLVSAARCARVSYLTHDMRKSTSEEDMGLAYRLNESKHLSPFEHPARATSGWHANFCGWNSVRNGMGIEP